MFSCVILAAGESRRFGSPKSLVEFEGQTLLNKLVMDLSQPDVDKIVVVLGSRAELIKHSILNHRLLQVVHNKDHNFGQTSSLQCGLRHVLPASKGILILPVDFPEILPDTYRKLIDHFKEEEPLILVPSFKGRKGHPLLFHSDIKEEYLSLGYEQGMNEVAHRRRNDVRVLKVDDPGVIQSFNSRKELKAIKDSAKGPST